MAKELSIWVLFGQPVTSHKELKQFLNNEIKKGGLTEPLVIRERHQYIPTISLEHAEISPAVKLGIDALVEWKKRNMGKIHTISVFGTFKEKQIFADFGFTVIVNNKPKSPQFISKVNEKQFETMLTYVCQSFQEFKWLEGKAFKE